MTISKLILKIENSKMLSVFLLITFVVLIIGIIIAYVISAKKSFFNVDASYYLGVTEQLYKGRVPIKDFALGYTPLSFYIMLIPRFFMGESPDYTLYIFTNYLFTFLSAILTSLIVKKMTSSNLLMIASVFLFLLFNFFLEGIYFVLEPVANVFGLLGIYLILSKSNDLAMIFLSGLLAGLSFLTKQYGLIYLGCLGLLVLVDDIELKLKVKRVIFLIVGFVAILSIVLLYFFLNGVSFKELILAFSGGGYGERTYSEYIKGFKTLVIMLPFIFLLPFIVVLEKNRKKRSVLIVFFITFLMMSLQYFFQSYLHYSIFLLPFSLIIVLTGLKSKTLILKIVIVLLIGCSGFSYSYKTVKRTKSIVKSKSREVTISESNEMKKILLNFPSQTMYALDGASIPYYFYLDLDPSMLKEYGYSFGFENNELIFKRTKNADLVLVSSNAYNAINEQLKRTLLKEFVHRQTSNFELFIKK